jgi:hypothetical protein
MQFIIFNKKSGGNNICKKLCQWIRFGHGDKNYFCGFEKVFIHWFLALFSQTNARKGL